MSDRDKLIELIMTIDDGYSRSAAEYLADHLIANGVTILPDCKGCQYEKRKLPQKFSCCRRNKDRADLFKPVIVTHWTEYPPKESE